MPCCATPRRAVQAIAGKLADAESMVLLKDLMNRLGCGNLQVCVGGGVGGWVGPVMNRLGCGNLQVGDGGWVVDGWAVNGGSLEAGW